MKRPLSFTEISTALDCQARHDFAYVGQLAGSALRRREPHVRLREGRAWGAAVAALHSGDPSAPADERYALALGPLHESLDADAEQLREVGFYDEQAHADLGLRLEAILWHYARTAEPMLVTEPEHELRVPIPSRAGARASSRYEFHAFLDGLTRDADGRLWLVEFKLRQRLTGAAHVALGRQFRFYAWAAERALREPVAGVVVDERLNEAPKAPRVLKNGKPSTAKDQLTTPEAYATTCAELGVEPDADTLDALGARKWQDRQPVIFRRSEIAEVDFEMRSAARLISALDRHALYPLRNPSPQRCGGCPFRDVCATPRDNDLIGALYERRPPKADREEIPA